MADPKTSDKPTQIELDAFKSANQGREPTADELASLRETMNALKEKDAADRAQTIGAVMPAVTTAFYAVDGAGIARTTQATTKAVFNATAEAGASTAARVGLSSAARSVPVIGNVAFGVAEAGYAAYKGDTKGVGEGLGGAFGAAAGAAAAGALVGSVVPGAGTAVGLVVGAIGGAVGYWLGNKAGGAAAEGLSAQFNEKAAGITSAPVPAIPVPVMQKQEQGFFAKLGF